MTKYKRRLFSIYKKFQVIEIGNWQLETILIKRTTSVKNSSTASYILNIKSTKYAKSFLNLLIWKQLSCEKMLIARCQMPAANCTDPLIPVYRIFDK